MIRSGLSPVFLSRPSRVSCVRPISLISRLQVPRECCLLEYDDGYMCYDIPLDMNIILRSHTLTVLRSQPRGDRSEPRLLFWQKLLQGAIPCIKRKLLRYSHESFSDFSLFLCRFGRYTTNSAEEAFMFIGHKISARRALYERHSGPTYVRILKSSCYGSDNAQYGIKILSLSLSLSLAYSQRKRSYSPKNS
jgi:hypothetical protein